MTPIPDATCLKVAGAWNPAIVTPQWIAKEALGKPAGDPFQVSVQLPIGIGGNPLTGPAIPQRFTFEGLSFIVSFDTLQFYFSDDDGAALAFRTAARAMEVLSHTPVFALGVNFGYLIDAPNDLARQSFGCIDLAAEQVEQLEHASVVQRSWTAALKLTDHVLNVTCTGTREMVQFELNHHYDVSGGAAASALLRTEGMFTRVRSISEKFAAKYQEDEAHD